MSIFRTQVRTRARTGRETPKPDTSDMDALDTKSPYSDIEMSCLEDMSTDPILEGMSEGEKREVIKDAFELYEIAKDIVAPVVVGFADDLLQESAGRKIMFAARDGVGTYVAAQRLLERFPESYEEKTDEDLLYPYLTRKVVFDANSSELVDYLHQCGVEDTSSPVVMADIGMFGSVVGRLKHVLPGLETRYLISRNASIPGYADDGSGQMPSMRAIIGNPAVHFIEDTFSGLTSSASMLLAAEDGTLHPDIKQDAYPAPELLKRKYALRAIEDAVAELPDSPDQNQRGEWVKKLDEFLYDPNNYDGMMVPHERG